MKITNALNGHILLVTVLVVAGCASQPKLTNEQILSQYQQVSSLDSALTQARSKGADYLAPESYAKASKSLANAMAAAEDNKSEKAEAAASKGLETVDKIKRDTERSRIILAEVLLARTRAYDAGVKTTQQEKIVALDKELKKTAALVENGDVEKAKQRRPKLINDYRQLELVALKQGTVNLAKASITNAKEQGAEKYAPKTLARAEEEMALAVNILDADRTQTAKADVYAKKAKWLADQSAAIAETVKDFDRRDYSMEDVVLWHQQELSVVNEPLATQLPFDQSTDKVTLSLRNAVSNLISENTQLKATGEKYGQQIALTEKERQAMEQKDREDKQKFDLVQAMFTASEANVYRQGQNVLISAHGFQFPSGQSEIQAGNFPLMNKITRAIKTFPNARVEVTGHTDSSGADETNQVLSEARAEKVAKFLVDLGGVAAGNVVSRGYGESRPVASNETREGRAENRRVEIKIINE